MPPRIAIPMPHSSNRDYSERAIVQYEHAVKQAGGIPVRIPLEQTPAEIMKVIKRCDALLLPGSNADVDPAKFGAQRSSRTAAADPGRDSVDELLLRDAYNVRKPILGICYGLQSLNVYRTGSLIQHIPEFLPEILRTRVNHEAGRAVPIAHTVEIIPNSKLARIVGNKNSVVRTPVHGGADNEGNGSSPADDATMQNSASAPEKKITIPVNSSHHQSVDGAGDGLRITARCPDDGIIEALEGTAPNHFVLAVQWHPERSVDHDESSRAIFRALVTAALEKHKELAAEFERVK
jgi:putative glutamine amidotransferase